MNSKTLSAMKKNMKNIGLQGLAVGLLFLGFSAGLNAQAPTEVKEVRKIRMVTVENGDTTIIERELGPDEELPVWHSADGEDHVIHQNVRIMVDGEGEDMPEDLQHMIEEMTKEGGEGEKGQVIIRTVEVKDGETVVDERIVRDLEDGEMPGEMHIEIEVDEGGDGEHRMIIIEEDDETMDGEHQVRVIRRIEGGEGDVEIRTHCTMIWITEADEEETEVLPREAGASGSELEPAHFSFFPNPNEGRFTLDMELPSDNQAEIRIYDLEGKQVYTDSHAGSTQYKKEIDISGFPKGAYLLEVSQDGRRMVRKIVTQ